MTEQVHTLARAVSTARRRLLPLIIALFVVNYLDRINVSVAALTMNADLGLSATAYGLGAGLLFLGYIAFEVPSNLVLARVGARRWITVLVLGWGLCAAGSGLVSTPTEFYALRLALGAFEAGFLPGMMLYLTQWFPRAERGRITAWFLVVVPLTGALGVPVSTWLTGLEGLGGLPGWRWMFLLEGGLAIVLSPLVRLLLPDGPDEARWLTVAQRDALHSALHTEQQDIATHAVGGAARALRDVRILVVGLIGFGIAAGPYALTFFLPQIVAGFRATYGVALSTSQVGLVTAVPSALAAVAMIVHAHRSDRRAERLRHIAVPLVPAAGALALAFFLHSPVAIMAAITVTTVGAFMALPVFWQLPSLFLTGRGAAAGIGAVAALGNASGFVAPYLTGGLKDLTGDYGAGMLALAGLMLLAAAATIGLGRTPTFGGANPTGWPATPPATARSRLNPGGRAFVHGVE